MAGKIKINTVAYKGSKRKLVKYINQYANEIGAYSAFDGFSGSGIVSAQMRLEGLVTYANDLNISSYIYGRVFLEGYNIAVVHRHIEMMSNITPTVGWLTLNYSGYVDRVIKNTGGRIESRPLGLIRKNAMVLDAARDYVENLSDIDERDRNALIFSIILAFNKVFNNTADQKSSLKNWSTKSLKDVVFVPPTLISGPSGFQLKGDVFNIDIPTVDFIYYDPPYSNGVLYSSCYHINDSIAIWDKPPLDKDYALPRPLRAAIRKNKQSGRPFYSKKTIHDDFVRLLASRSAKRIVMSYSDAPRNLITIDDLATIASKFGNVKIDKHGHKIAMQPKTQKKISKSLNEYFIVIDK